MPGRGPGHAAGTMSIHRAGPAIRTRRSADGYLRPTDHQRSGAGQRVCAGRTRLHDGLRDHQPDQLRPRRSADGGRAHQLDGRHPAGRQRPAGLADAADLADRRHRRLRGAQLHDREDRLPAAAQRTAPGAADHRDGHEPAAADAGDDHLEAELQALSHPAAQRALRRVRCCDQHDADPDPRDHRAGARRPDVPRQQDQARSRDARHGREPRAWPA